MITQLTKSWYVFDEAEVPRIIDALAAAGYRRQPHWSLSDGTTVVHIRSTRQGPSVIAHDYVWQHYLNVFSYETDPAAIAQYLLADGWRENASYSFVGNGAAIYIMLFFATSDTEYSLEIVGRRHQAVRDALAQLGIKVGTGLQEQQVREDHNVLVAPHRDVPRRVSHPLVGQQVYLPDTHIGVVLAAEAGNGNVVTCHVQVSTGPIEKHHSVELEPVIDLAPLVCRCGQVMQYQGLIPSVVDTGAPFLRSGKQSTYHHEQPMRVLVLNSAKLWDCACGARYELPVRL